MLDSSKAQTMGPRCPDDETDSEFQQFIDDQIDTIPQDFEELKNGTLPMWQIPVIQFLHTMKIVLRFHRSSNTSWLHFKRILMNSKRQCCIRMKWIL
ncbi:unnamed protein product [Camellia sinensis]